MGWYGTGQELRTPIILRGDSPTTHFRSRFSSSLDPVSASRLRCLFVCDLICCTISLLSAHDPLTYSLSPDSRIDSEVRGCHPITPLVSVIHGRQPTLFRFPKHCTSHFPISNVQLHIKLTAFRNTAKYKKTH